MNLIIDTEKKTVVVHGSCTFEAIEAAVKAVDPNRWASYRLTCENVSIADYGTFRTAAQKKAMLDSWPDNVGWNGEKLPKNTVRDLTVCPFPFPLSPEPTKFKYPSFEDRR